MHQPAPPSRPGGRHAEAARNDARILASARDVFVANPEAPIVEVARRAGVGIGALYRRYPTKEHLLRQLSADGQGIYIAEAETALADDGDVREALVRFMTRVVDADTHSLVARLAGTFTPTPEMFAAGDHATRLTDQLVERALAAGVLRSGIRGPDLPVVFEQLASIRVGDEERTRALRHRFLALALEALCRPDGTPPPGDPPSWEEITGRWSR